MIQVPVNRVRNSLTKGKPKKFRNSAVKRIGCSMTQDVLLFEL